MPNLLYPRMSKNRKLVVALRLAAGGDTSGLSDGVCRLAWPSPAWAEHSESEVGLISMLALPLGDAARRSTSALAQATADLLGVPHAQIGEMHELRWNLDSFSRGSYPVIGPGVMQPGFEAVLTGVPPLFFCGDWTLAGWAGYMEGALRSVQLVSGAVEEYRDHSS